jgi:hypothetical protein
MSREWLAVVVVVAHMGTGGRQEQEPRILMGR